MGKMVKATVTVRGIRPFFQNRFGIEIMDGEPKEKDGTPGNSPNEWRGTAMVTKDGQLYVEPTYAFSCICNGGKYTKKGRGTLQSLIEATLQVEDNRIFFDRYWPGFPNGHAFDLATIPPLATDTDEPVYMDVRGVKNPITKARNVRYRIVASPGYLSTFHMNWDKTVVSRAEMEDALRNAGIYVGWGNGRKIGMGRFEIVSFEAEDA